MNNKLKPAIIGGVVIGLLSIIPVIGLGNVCCCLWAILGGLLATYLYVKNSAVPATTGDGAIVGAIAGAIGGAIVIVLGIPISIVAGGVTRALLLRIIESIDPSQAEMLRMQMAASAGSIGSEIMFAIILAICLVIFSTLGGLLGVPLFEKRKAGNVPPPPQSF
ncbi:MAG: hypothetical protein QOD33_346 [Pyrinomonadaceae bacterium]|jgi:hypothetical protein|nr:hypothetical protein [Pyrinomonadaceae bacterium]